MDAVVLLLKKYPHSEVCSEQMVYAIIALGETTHMVMEIIGLYREPVVATLHEYGIHVTVPIHWQEMCWGKTFSLPYTKFD